VADDALLARLRGDDRIAFSYTDNHNGSTADIAGILSENRRVLGMMPHPERLNDPELGGTDGNKMFTSLAEALVSA
ncbi:MAG: phosphoribosylformylglycinamidine synthase subunit PurQ, partial [Rhodobacteraceae bacterium]|nr:phosphoribosylformylglycinamidine synthase subunit PurQ [Paracoccaceae bacterium]